MIFRLLYSSSLLAGHKNRNIFLYAIGSVIYVFLHWLLFSEIGVKIPYSEKFRSLIYVVFVGDALMVLREYQKSKDDAAKMARASFERMRQQPVFEEVDEDNERCPNGMCQLPQRKQIEEEKEEAPPVEKPEEKKEEPEEKPEEPIKQLEHVEENNEIPEKKEEPIKTPDPEDKESSVSLPIYSPKEEQKIPVYESKKHKHN